MVQITENSIQKWCNNFFTNNILNGPSKKGLIGGSP